MSVGGIGDATGAKLPPDGGQVAFCMDANIYFVDAKNGKQIRKMTVGTDEQ